LLGHGLKPGLALRLEHLERVEHEASILPRSDRPGQGIVTVCAGKYQF
jgi:hypothetical protein